MLISYSQNREDILLWRCLRHVKPAGFYVDVGANDPEEDSVTKLFYDLGWHGINIEPSRQDFLRLEAARERDINLPHAAGERDGEVTFFETSVRGWATSNARVGESYVKRKLANPVVVKMRTLNSVLEQHVDKDIHFLKIDVEGAEADVLAGLDLARFRPWIMLIEAVDPLTHEDRSPEWEPRILGAGYKRVFFDGLNTYYLAEEHSGLETNFNSPPNVLDEFLNYSLVRCMQAVDRQNKNQDEINDAVTRLKLQEVRSKEMSDRIGLLEAEKSGLRDEVNDAVACLKLQEVRSKEMFDRIGLFEAEKSGLTDEVNDAVARFKLQEVRSKEMSDRIGLLEAEKSGLLANLEIQETQSKKMLTRMNALEAHTSDIMVFLERQKARADEATDIGAQLTASMADAIQRIAALEVANSKRSLRKTFWRRAKRLVPPPVRRAYHALRAPLRPVLRKYRETIKRQLTFTQNRSRGALASDHNISDHSHGASSSNNVLPLCAAFIQSSLLGERVVYLYVDHTISCPTNTGVQRVTRGAATGLVAQNEQVRFVKWDSVAKRCVFISREEREHLAKWNGPAIDPAEWQFYHPVGKTPEAVPAHAIEANNWLIVPEVTHITPHAQPVTLDLISWARCSGLRNGFIFYDAIPLRRSELTDVASVHSQYMQHLRLADVVWPISEWSERDLVAYWGVSERATVKTMPEVATVPLPGQQGHGARVIEVRDGEPNILCVGSIVQRKNQLALVRAFQSYQQHHPNNAWTLTLVGNLHPDCANELHQAMQNDAAIHHKGNVSDEELEALYQSCAFTVFPSIEEGFGLPILESLWHAKPCLCASFGAMAEVAAGGGCYTVDVSDAAILREAVELMIESPELRQRLSHEAVRRELCTWDDYASKISARIDRQADSIGRLGIIYYWVGSTIYFPKNTGIQRVNRQLARALMAAGAKLVPVKWDKVRGEFVRPEIQELEHLAKWNGPGIEQWAQDPLSSKKNGGWFLMPDLPLDFATSEQMQFLSYAGSQGLRCAAIFYDAIPWKMSDIFPEAFSRAHAEYMKVIGNYDLVLPISECSALDLADYLSNNLESARSRDDYIRVTPLSGEFSESSRITVSPNRPTHASPLRILSVGTAEPRKNHIGMVEAFVRALKRSLLPMQLIIVGREVENCQNVTDALNNYIAQCPSIIWERDADDKRLRQLYEECDFTIYPSVEEGFGLPILESLWYAKPCICANFGVMAENASDGGCLPVDVRDPEALAAAILELAHPQIWSRLAEEATRIKFKSWADYAGEIAWHLAGFGHHKQTLRRCMTADEINGCARSMKLEKRPKLSVCISTYNRADWLAVNLKNWAEQCPTPIEGVEFLVCDNASVDHTPNVVKRYLTRPDFTYLRNPVNVGMLGNLRETANHARGEYIWIIGDDDLIMPGAVQRILSTISAYPDAHLIYLNYAFTHLKDARTIEDFASFFANATPIVPAEGDFAGPIKNICARNENFFTAIYALVFKRDHAISAYSQNTDGQPFSTMLTAIPTTYYVLNHMMDELGVWLGTPQIVVNMNVSWTKYIPLWILERIPEVYDLAEKNGATREEIDRWRRHTLPGVIHYFGEVFKDQYKDNARYVNPARLVQRFKHLPEFRGIMPQLQTIYNAAHLQGHFAAAEPASQIFPQFHEHR